ncbi:tetraspanin-7-like [Saccoglossus kowalevskii]|uniref:Tetraspanin n=1 Tax=Saccoglossus kowalevskii TaxID=10224 RepID=A0ABM0MJH6_SACKO|nr:PREDICTED: tetraspanin-7-like [Saccoglossus kowalevskii]
MAAVYYKTIETSGGVERLWQKGFTEVDYYIMTKRLQTTAAMGCLKMLLTIFNLIFWYGILLFVVLIAELAAGISGLVYREPLQQGFHDGLSEAVNDYNKDGHESDTAAVDELQESLECCGVSNYKDWNSTDFYLSGEPSAYPASCCDKEKAEDCVLAPSEGDVTVYTHGCYKKVASFMDKNMVIIGACAMGVAFFQVFGIILACCLANVINSNKYEMV